MTKLTLILDLDGVLITTPTWKSDAGEEVKMRMVRFRTLGCYPLTGAVASNAVTIEELVEEMLVERSSERQGRIIDFDEAGSMEQKKREGYF